MPQSEHPKTRPQAVLLVLELDNTDKLLAMGGCAVAPNPSLPLNGHSWSLRCNFRSYDHREFRLLDCWKAG